MCIKCSQWGKDVVWFLKPFIRDLKNDDFLHDEAKVVKGFREALDHSTLDQIVVDEVMQHYYIRYNEVEYSASISSEVKENTTFFYDDGKQCGQFHPHFPSSILDYVLLYLIIVEALGFPIVLIAGVVALIWIIVKL